MTQVDFWLDATSSASLCRASHFLDGVAYRAGKSDTPCRANNPHVHICNPTSATSESLLSARESANSFKTP